MKINIFDVVSMLICNAVIGNTNPLSMLRPGNKAFFPEKAELTLLSILQFELPEWFRNNKLRIGLHWELQRFTKFCISNTCLILNESKVLSALIRFALIPNNMSLIPQICELRWKNVC
jgi:hypothetical protein